MKMCGRFTLRARAKDVGELLQIMDVGELHARYNIAPSQEIAAVRQGAQGRELVPMRWGLIPSWAEDAKIGYQLINARSETAATKPAFRSAFRARRCLVPADGFYEWQKTEAKKKQPFFIRMKKDAPFAFAGLWEVWQGPEKPITSCTILTTSANSVVQSIHDRMPVILNREDYDQWLSPDIQNPEMVQGLLRPYQEKAMEAFRVGPLVNNYRNQDAGCIEPMK
jgi:putative SOS response-associated peptidase YedK